MMVTEDTEEMTIDGRASFQILKHTPLWIKEYEYFKPTKQDKPT